MENDFSAVFDGNDLSTIPNFVLSRRYPNELPTITLLAYDMARQDGQAVTGKRFGAKGLILEGYIVATDRATYEITLDTLKTLTTAINASLVLAQSGQTRQYICSLNNIVHSHIEAGKAAVSLVFTAGYPFGIETTQSNYSETAVTTTGHILATMFGGSAPSKPLIRITLNSFTGSGERTMTFFNSLNGQSLTITKTDWAPGDIVMLDCKRKIARVNDVAVDYNGVFPVFRPNVDSPAYSDSFTARNVDINAQYYREFL